MTRKIEKIEKNQIFCRESYFYWLNLFCICSQLSFEVYSSSEAQKGMVGNLYKGLLVIRLP